MGQWIDRLINKSTVACAFCGKKVDKKTCFSVKLNTAEGLHTIKACKDCGDDVNEVLKAIEEVKNDSPI